MNSTAKTSAYDVIILGAGGAGLMCAIEAGKRGRRVLVLDHAEKVGKKILISGGGRCNFTNIGTRAESYLSQNKHFCKSAFGQFTQHDFIAMVDKHRIPHHEKKLGQLFCDISAQQIVDMLLDECDANKVRIELNCAVDAVSKNQQFEVKTSSGIFTAESLVIATGGLSIPKMGATDFGYRIARQFNLPIVATTPALVPFTFSEKDLAFYDGLSGISMDAEVRCGKTTFRENILMTHRGVSGPAILQISSYWKQGQDVVLNLLPDVDMQSHLKTKRAEAPKQELKTVLSDLLPKRFIHRLFELNVLDNPPMANLSDAKIEKLVTFFTHYTIKPNGTEGYRKAEVTLGGVDTAALNARTLETKTVPNLYFIGEVVDVTGWLGGYNFQWAWSSGWAAGQVV